MCGCRQRVGWGIGAACPSFPSSPAPLISAAIAGHGAAAWLDQHRAGASSVTQWVGPGVGGTAMLPWPLR